MKIEGRQISRSWLAALPQAVSIDVLWPCQSGLKKFLISDAGGSAVLSELLLVDCE